MKRIKTKRVIKLIEACHYWMSCREKKLFLESVNKLIEAAGEDHPRVIEYINHPPVKEFYEECIKSK